MMTGNDTKSTDIAAEILASKTGAKDLGATEEIRLPLGLMLTQEWSLINGQLTRTPSEREVIAHFFDSSNWAYDMSQCDEQIMDGDLLIIPSEGIVAILVKAWPMALTEETGENLHYTRDEWSSIEGGRYLEIVRAAWKIIADANLTARDNGDLREDGEISTDQILDLLEPVDGNELIKRTELLEAAARACVKPDLDVAQKVEAYASHLGLLIREAMADVSQRYFEIACDMVDAAVEPLAQSSLVDAAREMVVNHPDYFEAAIMLYMMANDITDRDVALRNVESYRDYMMGFDDEQTPYIPDYDNREEEARDMAAYLEVLGVAVTAVMNDDADAVDKIHNLALTELIPFEEAERRVHERIARTQGLSGAPLEEADFGVATTLVMHPIEEPVCHVGWGLLVIIFFAGVVTGSATGLLVERAFFTALHWLLGFDLAIFYRITHLL
jgi:hypothetical protein